jgi:hypothetical protein
VLASISYYRYRLFLGNIRISANIINVGKLKGKQGVGCVAPIRQTGNAYTIL